MKRETLSPFPFYGGKARFAHEIAEMLDYEHTSVYVEPFGGACRVLLNKPRHEKEIYNDLGTGLVTFFETMSDIEKADKVIRKLNDMELSRDVFIEQQQYKNEIEMDVPNLITAQTLALISEISKKDESNGKLIRKARKALNRHEYPIIVPCLNELLEIITDKKDKDLMEYYKGLFEQYWKIIEKKYIDNYAHQIIYWINSGKFDIYSGKELDKQFDFLINMLDEMSASKKSKEPKKPKKPKPNPRESTGDEFSEERQEIIDDFLKITGGIEKIIEKLKKIELPDDADDSKKKKNGDTDDSEKKENGDADDSKKKNRKIYLHDIIHGIVLNELPTRGRGTDNYDDVDLAVATFYVYALSMNGMGIVYSENKGINTEAYYRQVARLDDIADRLRGVSFQQSHAIILIDEWRKYRDIMIYLDPPYLNDKKENLGKSYAEFMSYDEHEYMLDLLLKKDTRARILISNYDVEPYNSKLTEQNGWKKHEIETYTSVGSKKDNKRTEILWRNY